MIAIYTQWQFVNITVFFLQFKSFRHFVTNPNLDPTLLFLQSADSTTSTAGLPYSLYLVSTVQEQDRSRTEARPSEDG